MNTFSPALAPGLADRLEHDLHGLAVRLQVGRKAALVADAGRQAAALEDRPQRMEDLGAGAQPFRERREADAASP